MFWQLAYFVFLSTTLVVPFAAGRVLLCRIRSGATSLRRSIGLYALAVIAPPVLYLGVFFAAVGIEELTGTALIPEEIARSLLLGVAFGLLVWLLALLIFAMAAFRAARPPASRS